jgi:hypothetical protein
MNDITAAPAETKSRSGQIASWEPLLRGRKFVWILSPHWDNVWTRQNHFTVRMARLGAEILYVENPSSWISNFRQGHWKDLPVPTNGHLRRIEPGLNVMRPAISLPGSMRSNLLAGINGRLLSRQILRWIGQQGWSEYNCWCRVPYSLFTLQHLSPKTSVYDITDNYELYESNPRIRKLVRQREDRICARADLVFISSKELQQQLRAVGIESQRVPNGVEYDLFAQASQPGEVHPLVTKMGKPVIGYVGLTSHWMDFELLRMLGQHWPNKVLMLGPIAAQVEKRARSIPGIIWGGFVPQQKLLPYLRGFDVSIMPHVVNDLRRMSNPLKIWEYLATGKPFVSVDLPALHPVRHIVGIAQDRQHFVRLVMERLRGVSNTTTREGQEAAKAYSWDSIFNQMMGCLGPRLGGNCR